MIVTLNDMCKLIACTVFVIQTRYSKIMMTMHTNTAHTIKYFLHFLRRRLFSLFSWYISSLRTLFTKKKKKHFYFELLSQTMRLFFFITTHDSQKVDYITFSCMTPVNRIVLLSPIILNRVVLNVSLIRTCSCLQNYQRND